MTRDEKIKEVMELVDRSEIYYYLISEAKTKESAITSHASWVEAHAAIEYKLHELIK